MSRFTILLCSLASLLLFSQGAFALQGQELEAAGTAELPAEFADQAAPAPEPNSAFLAVLGGFVLLFVVLRRK